MLKSLEVFGFKSFADRTLFEFSPGITCVVGPNGSGKSNVVDSIKWILGDQSAKSLRGKEMSDVIFNGSNGRKPSGFSEATLTFDNTSKLFPVESTEVQIGRRLYRSGESEYLLNRAPVRLKDIRDLFMGTGAGTAAYSIIEQGRVDQILQSNPAARRVVFEEAAGISKYKARKVEAERRLERVAQNLARLTDIVDEVETQLNATRSQASKATRYRELSQELQEAWTGFAADEYRFCFKRLRVMAEQARSLEEQLSSTREQATAVEQERRELEERLSVIDDLFLSEQRKAASIRESIATLESTIHHRSERRRDLEQEISRLRRQQTAIEIRDRDARVEYATTEEKLALFAQQVEESRNVIADRNAQLAALQAETDQRKQQLQSRKQQLEVIQHKKAQLLESAAGLKSQLKSLKSATETYQEMLQQAEADVQRAGAAHHACRQELAEAESKYRNAQDAVARLQELKGDLVGQSTDTEKRLQELKERRSAAGARLAVLEEQELRQEGVAIGVRDILRRAEASRYPPWNTVLGVVRDLIEVPLELAPVIESALGERAQLITVTKLEPWLEYLNRGPAPIEGRVGFVATSDPGSENRAGDSCTGFDTDGDLATEPGVIGRADTLVEASAKAPGLVTRVLSDTWVVDSMDVSERLREKYGPSLRMVTLQGEVLESGDRLYLGTVPHESSLVSRRSELRQLKAEGHQLDRAIETLGERQTLLNSSLRSHDQRMDDALKQQQAASTLVAECATRLASSEQNLSRLNSAFQTQLRQVETSTARMRTVEEELAEVLAQQTEIDQQLADSRGNFDEEEQQLQEVVSILDAARQVIRDEQLELAKHEERLGSLQKSQARLKHDMEQKAVQFAEISQRLNEATAAHRMTERDVLRAGDDMAHLFIKLEELLNAQSGLVSERKSLRTGRSELSKNEEALHRHRRDLTDQQYQIEMQSREWQNQLKVLGERIHEEYQVSLEDLARGRVSAYRSLLQERFDPAEVEIKWQAELGDPEFDVVDELLDLELTEEAEGSAETVHIESAPGFEESREELDARVDRLRRKLKAIGHVNPQALEGLEECENRYASLSGQLQDLLEAKAALEDIIRRINAESKRIFLETFETIRVNFQELFRKLFGGGDADIILENPDDVLECGIDIVARPPGKELRSLTLLSGGEKTMTAVAMLFAMFKSKPSPYCILDEVDAALDEANVERYANVVREFASMTQFVIITHRKRTMTAANVIYGVTMEQAGVSKRMAVRFEEVGEHGEIKSRGAA